MCALNDVAERRRPDAVGHPLRVIDRRDHDLVGVVRPDSRLPAVEQLRERDRLGREEGAHLVAELALDELRHAQVRGADEIDLHLPVLHHASRPEPLHLGERGRRGPTVAPQVEQRRVHRHVRDAIHRGERLGRDLWGEDDREGRVVLARRRVDRLREDDFLRLGIARGEARGVRRGDGLRGEGRCRRWCTSGGAAGARAEHRQRDDDGGVGPGCASPDMAPCFMCVRTMRQLGGHDTSTASAYIQNIICGMPAPSTRGHPSAQGPKKSGKPK